jgi:hypothetical protein
MCLTLYRAAIGLIERRIAERMGSECIGSECIGSECIGFKRMRASSVPSDRSCAGQDEANSDDGGTLGKVVREVLLVAYRKRAADTSGMA